MEQEKDMHVADMEETKDQEAEDIVEEPEVVDDEEAAESPLQKELNETLLQNNQLKDKMLRAQAEFDNYKRRTEKERAAERKYKSQDLALELLPVLDNFERALDAETTENNQSFYDGVKMVYNQLQQALKTEEVEPMTVVDEEFDPNLHHAVMQVEEEDKPSNTVVEELQKGYMIKDRVIRPAMVKVNK
ncbi:MAG TPA: nucleotide exchange factor GrpE [Pseudogracilibacillus sp.]|nr:nucleotide exchange factor GrpE [Pseudogracilibacillus sp.]